jgi:hypothetical protein
MGEGNIELRKKLNMYPSFSWICFDLTVRNPRFPPGPCLDIYVFLMRVYELDPYTLPVGFCPILNAARISFRYFLAFAFFPLAL